MSLRLVLTCIVCPPLAVVNKGCGTILLVAIATLFGWIPGVLLALALGDG
ncbi:MAG: YqaE/Pmp3 family membrane protein [Acidobacteria bacterium]|nr:YqaE/Pmp3 family membrane protein [Acidobacteriota bacterium]